MDMLLLDTMRTYMKNIKAVFGKTMHFTRMAHALSLLIAMIGVTFSATAATIQVPQNQPTITAGVVAAQNGDTVVVSPGTYNEQNIPISKAITISSVGSATNTILDLQHNGRGFLITNASATPVIISGLTIENAQIPYYSGGGAFLIATGKCVISGCIIQGTSGDAGYSGGPVDNWATNIDDVMVIGCTLSNNFAANGCGITGCAVCGCLICNNSAGNNPMALAGCNATNCTVYGNTGGFLPNPWTAGGMAGGTADNCIFWANSGYSGQQIDHTSTATLTYSIIQGGFIGTGNLSSDPLFVDAANGDFHLQANSPAIHAGDPEIFNADGSRSDMGVYGGIVATNGTPPPGCIPYAATATATVDNGFVVGATITDGGCGYSNTPSVRIIGGGGTAAHAVAVVSNGVVTAVNVLDAGSRYTNAPVVVIAPPFIPQPAMGIKALLFGPMVTPVIELDLGDLSPYDNYQLEFCPSAGGAWTNLGNPFTPTATTNTQYVNTVGNVGFFRVKYVQ